MNEKDAIAKSVKLMTEIDSINEQLKEVLADAKESGLNPAVIRAVATAITKQETDKLKEKSEAIVKAIAVARS